MYFELQRGREKVRVNPDKELYLTITQLIPKGTETFKLQKGSQSNVKVLLKGHTIKSSETIRCVRNRNLRCYLQITFPFSQMLTAANGLSQRDELDNLISLTQDQVIQSIVQSNWIN